MRMTVCRCVSQCECAYVNMVCRCVCLCECASERACVYMFRNAISYIAVSDLHL